MITQIILNVIGKTLIGVISLIPEIPAAVMSRITQVIGSLGDLATWVAKWGVIMPWGTFWTAAQIFLAFWVASSVIYIVKFVVSLLTGGGAK